MTSVSVVTVVKDDVAGLIATVRSVASQVGVDLEYVVNDGMSEDGTWEAICRLEQSIDLSLREAPSGVYAAMNSAVAQTSCEWVLFLNAADIFVASNSLRLLADKASGTIDVISAGAIEVETGRRHQYPPRGEFWRGMVFDHQTCLVRRTLLLEHPFDEEMVSSADLKFFSQLRSANARFAELPDNIVIKPYEVGVSAGFEARFAEREATLQAEFGEIYPVDHRLQLEIAHREQ